MRGFFNSNSSELTSLLLEANHQMILKSQRLYIYYFRFYWRINGF